MTGSQPEVPGSVTPHIEAATPALPEVGDGTSPKRAGRWSKASIVLTTTLTVVGTVASVIGVIQVMTRDSTNFSHLSLSAARTGGEPTEWALPEAAIDSIPATFTGPCDAAGRAWLEANAAPLERRLLVSARNSATEGAMLALTDIRSVPDVGAERGDLSVRVVCDPVGSVPELIYYARVDADAASVARHVEIRAASNSAPQVPVTYNLAPGESGQIPVELFSRYPVSGSLEVSVHSGDEQRQVAIEGSEFELPALLFGGDMYLFTGQEGIACLFVDAGTISSCTMEQLAKELATAKR